MRHSGPLEERILIRELYAEYADASSRGEVEDWLDCWTDDCVWNSHIFRRTGKAELRAQWDQLWANFASLAFLSEMGPIQVDGDRAAAHSVAREIVRLSNGGLYKLVGRYEDRLVRRDGRWLFARRDYRPLVEELPQ